VLLALSGVFIILVAVHVIREPGSTKDKAGSIESKSVSEATVFPKLPPGPFQVRANQAAATRLIKTSVKKKETLSGVLARLGINANQVFALTEAAREVMNMKKVLPGDLVTLYLDAESGEPVRLEYIPGQGSPVIVIKTLNGYAPVLLEFEPFVSREAVTGRIDNTFWDSAVQLYKLDPEVVLTLTDIFAFDIDFFTDIRPGDEFSAFYEKKFIRGEFISTGRILAAKFNNNGRSLEAFYYENSKGEGGYYDSEGRSLRKMFLKSPLRYRRISSYFSRSRLHPILKVYRPHLGVDYAAPAGTPVETVGDGVVVFKGWSGGYGRFVKIKHNRTYTTTYGHLSRYAKGLRQGQRVKQGDLIGYVGSSGLSTGPHLDFRMMQNNKYINPLKMKLDPAPPLAASERPRFSAQVQEVEAEMSRLLAVSR